MINIKNVFTVAFFLAIILGIGPRIYVFLGIPYSMRPVNYYDFLNSFLLILIAFKLFIHKE
jgi:hypothetical protein